MNTLNSSKDMAIIIQFASTEKFQGLTLFCIVEAATYRKNITWSTCSLVKAY